MFCENCNKSNRPESSFCVNCGARLAEKSPDTGMQQPVTHMQQQAADSQQRVTDVQHPSSKNNISSSNVVNRVSPASLVGMFVVNLIPILGFPAAFLLASSKFKTMKIKLIALTSIFIAINIFATVFGYAAAITFMKSSLTSAAAQQNLLNDSPSIFDDGSLNPDQSTSIFSDDNSIIPGLPNNFLLPADFEGYDMPNSSEDNNGQFSSDIDDEGDIFFDADGDGVNEMLMDKDGNIFYDNDGDGIYDDSPPYYEEPQILQCIGSKGESYWDALTVCYESHTELFADFLYNFPPEYSIGKQGAH